MLERPDMVRRFGQIVPRHLNPERMLRVMAQAVYKTPKLAECDPISLLGAMQACASLGLEPNTPLGHAYLIPFDRSEKRGDQWVKVGTDVNLIIGYRGYIDLARRSGLLVSIHADVVYDGDQFDFAYGSEQRLHHRPEGRRDVPLYAYAHARLKDGEAFEVLPYQLVLQIRDNSEGYKAAVRAKNSGKAWGQKTYDSSPWVRHEHEMSAKTMVRRLTKWLPLSLEFSNAATLDAMSETGKVDFKMFSELERPEDFDPEAAEIIESAPAQITSQSAAPFDIETGEVKEPERAASNRIDVPKAAAATAPAQPQGGKPKLFSE